MPYRALTAGNLQPSTVEDRLLSQRPDKLFGVHVDDESLLVRRRRRNGADLLVAPKNRDEVQSDTATAFSRRFRNQSVQMQADIRRVILRLPHELQPSHSQMCVLHRSSPFRSRSPKGARSGRCHRAT
jgi:hypothetical protein